MTRALVVYESMFGNTKDVAEAVADGLRAGMAEDVDLVEVGHAPQSLAGVELLVVGAPTHALSLPRASTRSDAASKWTEPVLSPGPGLREWLPAFDVSGRVSAATFDTRIKKPLLPGSAAKAARRILRRRGVACVDSQSFWVTDLRGPLREGELERARRWGVELAGAMVHEAA